MIASRITPKTPVIAPELFGFAAGGMAGVGLVAGLLPLNAAPQLGQNFGGRANDLIGMSALQEGQITRRFYRLPYRVP